MRLTKIFSFYCFFFITTVNLFAQEDELKQGKNIVDVSYTNIFEASERNTRGNFTGSGFEIAYNRYFIKNKLYGRITYGKTYARAKNFDQIWTWKNDTPTMSVFSIGAGYDFLSKDKLTLGAEVSFLNLRHDALDYRVTDSEGNVKTVQYGKFSDGTIQMQLRARYFINHNFLITIAGSYGIMYTRYETFWIKAGIGYQF